MEYNKTVVQGQTAVTAYFSGKQLPWLLLFALRPISEC